MKSLISENGGSILNFNMHSDLDISLFIEIPENGVNDLDDALRSQLTVSQYNPIETESSKEYLIFLSVSFGRGRGKMRKTVPQVPG